MTAVACDTPAAPDYLHASHRPYRPYGAIKDLFYCRDPEILLSGPAGTGKSRGCLEKVHLCAEKYAGMRGLIVRKTRASLTESAMVTFEQKVVQEGHAILNGPQRGHRQAYHYPNGSTVVLGGMDNATRTLSTEYDLIYVMEAIELSEHEWEMLTRPLRNGVMPYQQIFGDTNPDAPTHWLKKRCDKGVTRLFDTQHQDNPTYWNANANDWTEDGRKYIEKLDRLTGPRKTRLRDGRWVQAEGVVYEQWNRSIHLISRNELRLRGFLDGAGRYVPGSFRRIVVGGDWGFTNPGVLLVGGLDGDGRLFIVEEIYQSKQTMPFWIDQAKRIKETYHAEMFVMDPSEPGNIKQFADAGLRCEGAYNEVEPGINAVRKRLQIQDDGKARLFFAEDLAAGRRDPVLDEAKRPCSVVEEFDCYVLNKKPGAKADEPVKENDHGMDALRYLVAHLDLAGKRRAYVAF
jgi:PBSX family phage terminase large subunit